MDRTFLQLELLSKTSSYYGPFDHIIEFKINNQVQETIHNVFQTFTDPIPNTVREIIEKYPEIRNKIVNTNLQDLIEFRVKINVWTVKDAHLLTFEKERFRHSFADTQTLTSKEIKNELKIIDPTESKCIKKFQEIIQQFVSSGSQEYLGIKLSETNVSLVSNYVHAYKLIFDKAKIKDNSTLELELNFVISDKLYVSESLTVSTDICSLPITIGSQYQITIKSSDLDLETDLDLNPSQIIKSHIFVPVGKPWSKEFDTYVNLMDRIKNHTSYSQVDDILNTYKQTENQELKKYIKEIANQISLDIDNLEEKIEINVSDFINY